MALTQDVSALNAAPSASPQNTNPAWTPPPWLAFSTSAQAVPSG